MFKTLSLWVPRIVALTERFPWAMPLFGFVSGLASFFLVERKEEIAQIIAILMLASWGWLILEKFLRRYVASHFGWELPPPLLNYFAQLVHQESLFFIIPFFAITTSWNSGQTLFTGMLLVAALVSIIDPLYFRWLAPRRWLYFTFHGVTLFAVLLTALPIIFQLPTSKSYALSLGIALAITLPSVAGELAWRWWQRGIAIILLALFACLTAYIARPWVPPATLWLTEVAITDHIDSDKRSPDNSLSNISAQQLRNGVFAFTSIHAPRGLNERIYHVWQLNGQQIDKVALDINGGREAGYRAWSHKVNFPENSLGRWQIRVVTEANQVIGVLRFRVVDQAGLSNQNRDRKPSSNPNPAPSSNSPASSTPTSEPAPETTPETVAAPVSAVPTTPDSAMKAQLMKLVE